MAGRRRLRVRLAERLEHRGVEVVRARAVERGEHQRHVLEQAVEREGGELAGEHRAALEVRVRGVGGAARDRVEEEPGLDAEQAGEAERLAGGRGDGGDPGVARELEGGSRSSVGTGDHGARAGRLEDGAGDGDVVLGSRDEVHEEALLGGAARAEDGRVHEAEAVLGGERGDAAGALDADGGGLEHDGSGAQRGSDLGEDLEHGIRVEQHHDHDVGVAHRVGGGLGDGRAGVGERGGLIGAAVPDGERQARAEDRAAHAGAHDAGAEERHAGLPVGCGGGCGRGSGVIGHPPTVRPRSARSADAAPPGHGDEPPVAMAGGPSGGAGWIRRRAPRTRRRRIPRRAARCRRS